MRERVPRGDTRPRQIATLWVCGCWYVGVGHIHNRPVSPPSVKTDRELRCSSPRRAVGAWTAHVRRRAGKRRWLEAAVRRWAAALGGRAWRAWRQRVVLQRERLEVITVTTKRYHLRLLRTTRAAWAERAVEKRRQRASDAAAAAGAAAAIRTGARRRVLVAWATVARSRAVRTKTETKVALLRRTRVVATAVGAWRAAVVSRCAKQARGECAAAFRRRHVVALALQRWHAHRRRRAQFTLLRVQAVRRSPHLLRHRRCGPSDSRENGITGPAALSPLSRCGERDGVLRRRRGGGRARRRGRSPAGAGTWITAVTAAWRWRRHCSCNARDRCCRVPPRGWRLAQRRSRPAWMLPPPQQPPPQLPHCAWDAAGDSSRVVVAAAASQRTRRRRQPAPAMRRPSRGRRTRIGGDIGPPRETNLRVHCCCWRTLAAPPPPQAVS